MKSPRTTTNAEGNYTFPFLSPGLYTLTVEMSRVPEARRSDMRLEVSQIAADQRRSSASAASTER